MGYIRSAAVGYVIGKGGEKLKEIREPTGTKLKIEREEIHGQRPCIISGPHHQVMQAVSLVHELLATSFDSSEANGAKRFAPPGAPPHIAATANGKRQKVGIEEGITKLLMPAKSAGLIIGKQGSGLALIRQTCSVHLEVLQAHEAPQWFEDRVVKVQGCLQSRVLASIAVLRSAFHADLASVQLKMLVPEARAGAVVGKQGVNLKMIREQSGINVNVEKQAMMGDRLVSAQGTLESVGTVLQRVLQSVEGSLDPSLVPPTDPSPVAPTGYAYVSGVPPARW